MSSKDITNCTKRFQNESVKKYEFAVYRFRSLCQHSNLNDAMVAKDYIAQKRKGFPECQLPPNGVQPITTSVRTQNGEWVSVGGVFTATERPVCIGPCAVVSESERDVKPEMNTTRSNQPSDGT